MTQQKRSCDVCITLKQTEEYRENYTIKFVSTKSFVVVLKYIGTFQGMQCDFFRSTFSCNERTILRHKQF